MVRSFSRGRQIISTSDPLVVMFCVSNYKQRRYEQQTKKFLLSAFILVCDPNQLKMALKSFLPLNFRRALRMTSTNQESWAYLEKRRKREEND